MTVVYPPAPTYPEAIDTNRTLFLVYNTSEARLAVDNNAWSEEVEIVPVDVDKPEIWADNGFASISGELFYYDSVDKNEAGKVYKLKRCARNLGGQKTKFNSAAPEPISGVISNRGTWVRGFVIAEHHNQLVDAVIQAEVFVINLNNLVNQLVEKIPCPGICPDVTFTTDETKDQCQTTISYAVTINGSYSSFLIDFGDGTSTSSNLTGTHTYPNGSTVNPVVGVTSADCEIVQTPPSSNTPQIPTPPPPPTWVIPIPPPPDFPDITIPDCPIITPEIEFPQIIFPYFDIPSISFPNISIPSINIPSIITVIDSIPSIINVIDSIPSVISIVGPHIPSIISIIGPDLPSVISIVGPNIPSVISIVGPDLPSVISITNPHIPNVISVHDSMPSTIDVHDSIPSTINVHDSIPSVISITNPHIPNVIGVHDSMPSTIDVHDSIPSTINVHDSIPSIISVMDSMPSTISVHDSIPSVISVVDSIPSRISVDWGHVPSINITISVTCGHNKGKQKKHNHPKKPKKSSIIRNRPFIEEPLPFPHYTPPKPPIDDIDDDFIDSFVTDPMDVEANSSGLGIPSEIKILPPEIPDIRIIHDLDKALILQIPDKPIEIRWNGKAIPDEVKVVNESVPETISVMADIPKTIKVDASDLVGTFIRVEVPEDFPRTIKLDASDIPETIQVTGIPQSITVEMPSRIVATLEVPENLEIPLVYRGGPIPLQLESSLVSNDENRPCFTLVPCGSKK